MRHPAVDPRVIETAAELDRALKNLQVPMRELAQRLAKRLDTDADVLDPQTRLRIEAMARGIARRAENEITAWRDMLGSLKTETPPDFVDWFALERNDGREIDVGLFRHWRDPMRPFAEIVAKSRRMASSSPSATPDRRQRPRRNLGTVRKRGPARGICPSPPSGSACPRPSTIRRRPGS